MLPYRLITVKNSIPSGPERGTRAARRGESRAGAIGLRPQISRRVGRAGGRAHLAGANRLIREAFYWDCSSRRAPLRKPKQRRRNERRPQIVGRRKIGEEINNGRRRK